MHFSFKVAHNQASEGRVVVNSRLGTLQRKKTNLDALQEQLRELKERRNALVIYLFEVKRW